MATHPQTLTDSPLEIRRYSWREILRRTLPMVRGNRRQLLIATVTITLVGLAMAVQPLFVKPIIDVAIPTRDGRLAVLIAVIFVAVMFLRMALWYVGQAQAYWVFNKLLFRMRSMGFAHVQTLCLRFHHQVSPGQLYERIFGVSLISIAAFILVLFQQILVSVVGLVLALGFCLWLSPPMTLAVVLGAVGYVAASRFLSPRIYEKTKRLNESHGEVTEFVLDKIRGTKTIQAFGMEDRVKEDFDKRVWAMTLKFNDAQREQIRLGFITEGISYLLTAVVLVGGAYSVLGGDMKLGTLVVFMGYQGQLIWMMTSLTNSFGQFSAATAGFEQFFTILDTASTVIEKPSAVMPAKVHGRIEFRHVTFTYGGDKMVLRDFSLDVPPGQTVALVGHSGSGKTTLTNLILRYYDPDSGSVLLDGTDIRVLPLHEYRQQFGMVLQEPYLFDDTILYNLRCARPQATVAELRVVLEKAQAWEFVNAFPDGLNHRVGEGGRQLSGGQKQRLAIARCMLTDSRFVLLDEPTSALDNESEHEVQMAFDELFRGRTVFIIAHRLSTIRNAGRILVLDQGRIVEDGNYQTLMKLGGIFARLQKIGEGKQEPGPPPLRESA